MSVFQVRVTVKFWALIGSLAGLLALQGFWITRALDRVERRVDRADDRLDRIGQRLDHIADTVLRDHSERIARLEERGTAA